MGLDSALYKHTEPQGDPKLKSVLSIQCFGLRALSGTTRTIRPYINPCSVSVLFDLIFHSEGGYPERVEGLGSHWLPLLRLLNMARDPKAPEEATSYTLGAASWVFGGYLLQIQAT